MPATNGSNGVFWYSYDMGPVHTAVVSSEHDLAPGSPQHEWLQTDLKAVNRTLTPWLIVESHRPMYQGEALWDQNAVVCVQHIHLVTPIEEARVHFALLDTNGFQLFIK